MVYVRGVLIFIWLSAGIAGHAQIKGFIGIQGGGQFSSAYFEHTLDNLFINTTFIPGGKGGLMFKLFTNQGTTNLNAGLQTGLTITQKGWKQTFTTDEPGFVTRMAYAELPMEALAYIGHGKTKFFFTLGMYLEYLLQVKSDDYPDLTNLGGADFYPYLESRDRKFGYGGRGSIGVMHDFGFGMVHVDGFFTFSMRSMMEYGEFSSGIPDLSNNYAVGFSIAYLIPFGKMDF